MNVWTPCPGPRYNDGISTQWILQSDPTVNTGPTLLSLQDVTDIGYTTDNPIIITNTNGYLSSDYSVENFIAGYGNTTSAINAIQFKYASGNIADGTILMYGIK